MVQDRAIVTLAD